MNKTLSYLNAKSIQHGWEGSHSSTLVFARDPCLDWSARLPGRAWPRVIGLPRMVPAPELPVSAIVLGHDLLTHPPALS